MELSWTRSRNLVVARLMVVALAACILCAASGALGSQHLARRAVSTTSIVTTTTQITNSSGTTITSTTTTTSSGSGSNSGSSSSSAPAPLLRLRATKVRRPEFCRESLPRKSEDLPVLVITGRIKELYLAGEPSNVQPSALSESLINNNNSQGQNKALVGVLRVIKGNQQLVNSDIIVGGFNGSSAVPCPNYVKPNDTWIMLLNSDGDRKYTIQGANLLSMTLTNLDRINAVAADEPYKRRPPIEDIGCEAHYCAYGRCKVQGSGLSMRLTCHCPETCDDVGPSPVCGSDNTTYTNECQLIREGCRRQKPLFVTKETSC